LSSIQEGGSRVVILITTELFVVILFFILGWAIQKKEAYWLISGFASRPKEDQDRLITNGLPQRTGKLLIATAVGLLLLLPLAFTTFKYAIEVQFGFMILFLLGGLIYLSKYEVAHKRKSSYVISISLFIVVIGSLSYLSFLGYQDYRFIIKNESVEITGMYGDEWKFEEIKKVVLLEKMPKVTSKQNGFGTTSMAKGVFSVTGYGNSLLFIKKGASAKIIYIETEENKIFINGKNTNETEKWFNNLQKYIN
jgi:hypothetical protein